MTVHWPFKQTSMSLMETNAAVSEPLALYPGRDLRQTTALATLFLLQHTGLAQNKPTATSSKSSGSPMRHVSAGGKLSTGRLKPLMSSTVRASMGNCVGIFPESRCLPARMNSTLERHQALAQALLRGQPAKGLSERRRAESEGAQRLEVLRRGTWQQSGSRVEGDGSRSESTRSAGRRKFPTPASAAPSETSHQKPLGLHNGVEVSPTSSNQSAAALRESLRAARAAGSCMRREQTLSAAKKTVTFDM